MTKALIGLAAVTFGIMMTPPVGAAPVRLVSGTGEAPTYRSFEDDQGGFFVVWSVPSADGTALLRAQHIDAHKRFGWDAPADPNPGSGLVVSAKLISARDWDGLADGRGGIILFWDEKDGTHAQRFLPDASRRHPGESIRVSTSTALQPDAVPDAVGGTLVAWRDQVEWNRGLVRVQRFDSEGDPVWPDGGLRVSYRASDQSNPKVIPDQVSGMIVAWRDEAAESSELRVQRIDFDGNRLWGALGLRITAPIGKAEFPQIAALGSGGAVVAYPGSLNQTNQVFLQRVSPDGKLLWGPNGISSSKTPPTYNRWNPVLVGDESGGAWIGWEDYRNQAYFQVQLNHVDGNGRSVWPAGEMAIAPAQGEQGKLALALDGTDGLWAAWIDSRLATIGLYVQQIDQAGNRRQGPRGRRVADRLVKPSVPQLVPLAPQKTAVVWTDQPKRGQWTLSWDIVENP